MVACGLIGIGYSRDVVLYQSDTGVLMIGEYSQYLEQAKTLSADKRTTFMTVLVFWTIVECVYYIVLGVVVIVIGRRMINAALTAWREIRREPS